MPKMTRRGNCITAFQCRRSVSRDAITAQQRRCKIPRYSTARVVCFWVGTALAPSIRGAKDGQKRQRAHTQVPRQANAIAKTKTKSRRESEHRLHDSREKRTKTRFIIGTCKLQASRMRKSFIVDPPTAEIYGDTAACARCRAPPVKG